MTRKPAKSVTIREIDTRKSGRDLFGLVRQTNPKMTQKQFDARLAEMNTRGYRCVGAYMGDALVGIAGFWIGTRFWCGRYVDVDNVVVDAKHRNLGIGTRLMRWVEKEAKKLKCDISVLDSYTTFHDAHRFYFREGYVILGYHFTKDMK